MFWEEFNPAKFTTVVDSTGEPSVIYIGIATTGNSNNKDKPVWSIRKITDDGSGNVEVLFSGGVLDRSFVWNDRTTLAYS